MNIELNYSITPDEFLEMVESVGWKTYTKDQVEKALKILCIWLKQLLMEN